MGKYVTNTHQIAQQYKGIVLHAQDAKVKIEPSNHTQTTVVFYQKEKRPYEVSLENGILTIQPKKSKWYNFLKMGVDHSEITLCVPNTTLETLWVKGNVGQVCVRSIHCSGTVDIQTNTGKIILENSSCKTFQAKGNTGSITLCNLTSTESINVKQNTGKVELNNCLAPTVFVKTNTGKVCGKLPSNTVFAVRTTTGKIEVPTPPVGETVGGKCEIMTNTGNVHFE